MGNHSASMTPPNAQVRQPPPGSQEAYGGVRLEAMPGGGRIVNDPAAAAAAGAAGGRGRRTHGSWVANPPTRPQTVVQKTKMVRNTCHVRKDTVRLLPTSSQPLEQEGGSSRSSSSSSSSSSGGRYHLSFRFDADVPCKIAVYWAATEGKDEAGRLCHTTRMPAEEEWLVGPHRFDAGANQLYSTAALGYEGADLHKASLVLLGGGGGAGGGGGGGGKGKGKEKERGGLSVYIVLRPCVEEESGGGGNEEGKEGGEAPMQGEVHAQVTMLSLESKTKTGGGGGGGGGEGKEDVWVGRVVNQKIQTPDGIFVLQEIYGIAGTTAGAGRGSSSSSSSSSSKSGGGSDGGAAAGTAAGAAAKEEEEEEEMSRAECVVCLTNKRELAILPCRHMCVCRACAAECIQESLAFRCPICRNPAQALLKLTLDEDDQYRRPSATPTPQRG